MELAKKERWEKERQVEGGRGGDRGEERGRVCPCIKVRDHYIKQPK